MWLFCLYSVHRHEFFQKHLHLRLFHVLRPGHSQLDHKEPQRHSDGCVSFKHCQRHWSSDPVSHDFVLIMCTNVNFIELCIRLSDFFCATHNEIYQCILNTVRVKVRVKVRVIVKSEKRSHSKCIGLHFVLWSMKKVGQPCCALEHDSID